MYPSSLSSESGHQVRSMSGLLSQSESGVPQVALVRNIFLRLIYSDSDGGLSIIRQLQAQLQCIYLSLNMSQLKSV